MDLMEVEWEDVDWIHLVHDRDPWRGLLKTVINSFPNVFDDGAVLLRSIIWTLSIVLMFCNHLLCRFFVTIFNVIVVVSYRLLWYKPCDCIDFRVLYRFFTIL
jgi:hypothetical protein